MDQNRSWLIVSLKQFQFFKSKILFSCCAPLNSEPFLTHPVNEWPIFQKITLSDCQPIRLLESIAELIAM